MTKLYGLTDNDLMKLRDIARRVGGGSGSQRPNHKRRRQKLVAGGAGTSLIPAILVGDVPGATNNGTTKITTPGISSTAICTIQSFDGTTYAPAATPVTRQALNRSVTTIRASTAEPVAVEGYELTAGGTTYFVVVNVMDLRALPGYVKSAFQGVQHVANADSFGLDAKVCT